MTTEVFNRLLAEKEELAVRISRLRAFLLEHGAEVSEANKILLDMQLDFMEKYESILDVRIELNVPCENYCESDK